MLSQRRELPNYETNDSEMLHKVLSTGKPDMIKMCNGAVDPANPILDAAGLPYTIASLIGYQVIYGTGANKLAGPAHGDVTQGCSDYAFPSRPIEINFYYGADQVSIEGLRVLFDNGVNPLKKAINGGIVEFVGQFKSTKAYAATDVMQFFGFVV